MSRRFCNTIVGIHHRKQTPQADTTATGRHHRRAPPAVGYHQASQAGTSAGRHTEVSLWWAPWYRKAPQKLKQHYQWHKGKRGKQSLQAVHVSLAMPQTSCTNHTASHASTRTARSMHTPSVSSKEELKRQCGCAAERSLASLSYLYMYVVKNSLI